VILKAGPNRHMASVNAIIWEHGRRNAALRADGLPSIVCPVADGSDVTGVGIFNLGPDETQDHGRRPRGAGRRMAPLRWTFARSRQA
jgi:hypothetical protein